MSRAALSYVCVGSVDFDDSVLQHFLSYFCSVYAFVLARTHLSQQHREHLHMHQPRTASERTARTFE